MADPVLYVVERVRVTALRDDADLLRPATDAEVLAHPAVRALVEAGEEVARASCVECRDDPRISGRCCEGRPDLGECPVARWRRVNPLTPEKP